MKAAGAWVFPAGLHPAEAAAAYRVALNLVRNAADRNFPEPCLRALGPGRAL